ncbi:hypothetical protein NDU88_008129 [Pleurodeles waltl]|uniref:Uncharacterized protein n=1 Tax=Pleurodeles waltl TaxID=8319 RepID=A0AAV7QMN5_PLEWA|nr:hypothetical protein NDU88_008127 [Pleurodeles waltl]KAJ1141801.1 hypothetical protein NDU88_008129 [Pleurodeles waltl]
MQPSAPACSSQSLSHTRSCGTVDGPRASLPCTWAQCVPDVARLLPSQEPSGPFRVSWGLIHQQLAWTLKPFLGHDVAGLCRDFRNCYFGSTELILVAAIFT